MIVLKAALIGALCGAILVGILFYLSARFGEGGGFFGSLKDVALDWGIAGACAGAVGGLILGLLTGLTILLIKWIRAG